jgi:hypothetical protein
VWDTDGLLPTQRCIGQGPAGATGLVLREGVVIEVSVKESALAQQMPEDWAADLQRPHARADSERCPARLSVPRRLVDRGVPAASPDSALLGAQGCRRGC